MPTSESSQIAYALDSSAILAYVLNESGATQVAQLYERAGIPFVAVSELYAALWGRFGRAKADEVVATIRQWPSPWLWPNEAVVLMAGSFRALYRLGLGDSLIAALAVTHQAVLVTKDPDFRPLQPALRLLYLDHT